MIRQKIFLTPLSLVFIVAFAANALLSSSTDNLMVRHDDQASEANEGRVFFRYEIDIAISVTSIAILSSTDTVLGTCLGFHEVSKVVQGHTIKTGLDFGVGKDTDVGGGRMVWDSANIPSDKTEEARSEGFRHKGGAEGKEMDVRVGIDEVEDDCVDLEDVVTVGGYGMTGAELEDFNPSEEWDVRIWRKSLVALKRRLR